MSAESPLLQPTPSKKLQTTSTSTSPSPSASFTITTLAILRMGVGVSALAVPRQISPFFGIPLAMQTTIVARLFAARDFMLGALVWTARPAGAREDYSEKELKRALWAGIIVDSIDVASCVVGLLEGSLEKRAIVGVGAGAAFLVGLGLLGLRGV